MQIEFEPQLQSIVIKLHTRTQKQSDKDCILIECYGKDFANRSYQVDRKQIDMMVKSHQMSEYDFVSGIYTLITPENETLTGIVKCPQRSIINHKTGKDNVLRLIHIDFAIINDTSEIDHRVAVKIAEGSRDRSQDYKNGSILHLLPFITCKKTKDQAIKDMPVKVKIDISDLRKNESISYQSTCIASLKKR